ncbi:hypothetical protein TMatcc_001721 [Talaromyces marneffei ATCC 18224]|uniref:Uncharacterized protein n=2 Tax=Talaromyces marneffei TaxID=37727 RepID=B6QHM0_TALMQ|nr:uncharacterized protein EYB26_007075 [Talaromyces marneffei]EEA22865.1 hypothetical protein PMAA_094700 [Talaromyces marneffei ATCC 18224]KAE8551741.1 hypothetical protein EYB25_005631 [Talaromyces marneffei]QGA19386.1 hypothetical protein EYB26_007075 [Talaromyces marneffei]
MTSPSNTSKSILMDNQINQDSHNESSNATLSTTTEIQDREDDDVPKESSFSMSIQQVKAIIQQQLIEGVIRLPEGCFERHMQLQRDSPFWMKVFNQPQDSGHTWRPAIKSREWAEYVVDASRIYFEADLSVKKAVSIINYAIRYVAICLLNRGTEKIYFEDGRNVFYEYKSRGMPAELKAKYKAFLKEMRTRILVKVNVLEDSKAHSESRSEDEIEQVVDVPSIVITPPMEPPSALAEPKASTIKTEGKRDDQKQNAKKPQPKKKGRNRTRKNSKKKGKKKRARKAMLLSQSKNLTESESKVKGGKWRRKNQKRKEKKKMKKATEALNRQ